MSAVPAQGQGADGGPVPSLDPRPERLACTQLALRYAGSSAALHFPDLRLQAGQHLLLRGASGTGKSSLLGLLTGLLAPTGGQVRLAGQDLAALTPAQRDRWRGQHVGVLPQRLHLCEGLSVWDNLCLPFAAAGQPVPTARLQQLCERLGLAALRQRPVERLSGGQAQRVAFARALARGPALLVLDEPSSSLDDGATQALLDLLDEAVSNAGAGASGPAPSLVVATHDARVVQGLGHRWGAALQVLTLEAGA